MSLLKYYNLGKNILYPINRSITGSGIKKSLKIIQKEFKELKIKKVKSGTKVFDWKVPHEWNVSEAYIMDKYGHKIVDFSRNNLHLIGYSQFTKKILNTNQLMKHLYSLPKQPNAIPYITSYYKKYWGFCVTHKEKMQIKKKYKSNDYFKVYINSKFNKKGNLNFGELIIKGKSKQEILISTYICHPSMANNELSGPIVCMSLINYFKKIKKLNKTLRFIFIPETIGSITYLKKNFSKLKNNIIGGYNITCVGDNDQHSCMFTKYKDSLSDSALKEAYKKLKIKYKEYSFIQRGSDERQYNSPGIDLPIASIFRTKYGEYPQYHTSLDDFNYVSLKGLQGGYKISRMAITILSKKIIPWSKVLCEPFLSKRNLYPTLSIKNSLNNFSKSILDVIQYCDGKNDLKKISKITNIKITVLRKILKILKKEKLIRI